MRAVAFPRKGRAIGCKKQVKGDGMKRRTGKQIVDALLAIPKADREAVYGVPSPATSALCEYSLIGPSCGLSHKQVNDLGNWVEKRIFA